MMGECFYCGFYEELTRDHVIPQSRGRLYRRPWNIVWACAYCNNKKGNHRLAVWLRYLASEHPHASKFGHEPKRLAIMEREPRFIAELLARPELSGYRGELVRPGLAIEGEERYCKVHWETRSFATCLWARENRVEGTCLFLIRKTPA